MKRKNGQCAILQLHHDILINIDILIRRGLIIEPNAHIS